MIPLHCHRWELSLSALACEASPVVPDESIPIELVKSIYAEPPVHDVVEPNVVQSEKNCERDGKKMATVMAAPVWQ